MAGARDQPADTVLRRLGSDEWAVVLPVVRRVLAADAYDGDARAARFRAAPTSRLVGGPLRRALCQWLAADEVLWAVVADGLRELPELPAAVTGLLADPSDLAVSTPVTADRDALDRLSRRLREARDERDVWRRRAEGADSRTGHITKEVSRLESELTALVSQLQTAEASLAAAAAERARAVERERRRRDTEVAALEEQLAALRRADEQRRTEQRRRAEARRQAARDAQQAAADAAGRGDDHGPLRVAPGRPSRLPRGVTPGTTEAAAALLHRGRRVLVDGYNVTKQHRGRLDLETQRTWLIQQIGVLARRTGIVPLVVFDGQERGGSRPPAGLRDVEVAFTDAGITADDELVLAVEATDAPVVVVTDDRDLIARVRVSGADVVDTRSFVGLLS